MSNQIGYVLVIASANYKQPIFSVLRQEDIAYQDPLSENENFLEYIKKNNARISDYDAVIIDLGAVSDSDADIMTALETIRFVDDHIRLIILSGARPSGYAILHQNQPDHTRQMQFRSLLLLWYQQFLIQAFYILVLYDLMVSQL